MPKKKQAEIKIPKSEESLLQISKFAKILAGYIVMEQVKKIASTDERRIIWVFCEGKMTREQIAAKTKIPKRTVSYFIDECMNLGLLEEEKGKGGRPKRLIDFVPDEWKRLAREKLKIPQQPAALQQT
jgi:predicted HTH transcriptional regulator